MTPIASLAGPIVRLQPDSRLVALTRDGHELAFNEIVRRYRSTLVRFAAGIGPRSSAEDVVQDALARAHVAITDSDAEITLRPWLYTIVRNRALNARRDERPHEQLDPEYDGVPQPPTIAAEREELAATIAAIQALPSQQRDAIVMRELEGMSHDDIAAHLGASKGSVRQLIFRARTTLRDGLGSLVPLPVVRSLLESDAARVATAGAGAGAVVASGGGGGALGLKGGVALVVAGLAIGSGVAIHDRGKNQDDHVALAAPAHHGSRLKAKEVASTSSAGHQKASEPRDDSSGDTSGRRVAGEDSSSHNRGPGGDDSSGHGGGPARPSTTAAAPTTAPATKAARTTAVPAGVATTAQATRAPARAAAAAAVEATTSSTAAAGATPGQRAVGPARAVTGPATPGTAAVPTTA